MKDGDFPISYVTVYQRVWQVGAFDLSLLLIAFARSSMRDEATFGQRWNATCLMMMRR